MLALSRFRVSLNDMVAAVLEHATDDPRAIIRQISALYRQIAELAALGWKNDLRVRTAANP